MDEFRVVAGASPTLADRPTRVELPDATDKSTARARLAELQQALRGLHADLWAENERALLLVLQGMDCSGKDGTIRRVFSGLNPQGIRVSGFRKPSEDELDRDYLWRVHARVPPRGEIGIWNRSHYEDVGIVRVASLVPEERWRRRYRHIREFERLLTDEGTTIIKCWLHISSQEQRARLQDRVDEPAKHWKFRMGDLDHRKQWDEHLGAYEEAIAETSTEHAPWFVVPADSKWRRDVVVATIVRDTLAAMNPQPPAPDSALTGLVVQ